MALPDDKDTIMPICLHTCHAPIREPICLHAPMHACPSTSEFFHTHMLTLTHTQQYTRSCMCDHLHLHTGHSTIHDHEEHKLQSHWYASDVHFNEICS